MIPAFVLNLDRRPDRLERFNQGMAPLAGLLDLRRIPGVDGRELDLNGPLRQRINPWNFEHLSEAALRGGTGCALGHLRMWETIAALDVPYALAFEDDAVPVRPDSVAQEIQRLPGLLPPDLSLAWLNDWDRPHAQGRAHLLRFQFRRLAARLASRLLRPRLVSWTPSIEMTCEAYLITPACATALVEAIKDNLGAVDHHMLLHLRAHPELRALRYAPAPFRQCNRKDTDIQLG